MLRAGDLFFIPRKTKQELSIKSDPRQLIDAVRKLQYRLRAIILKSDAPIQHSSIDFMRNILNRRDSYD